MANVQHDTEEESDEDCEVYFLKPVNEYNIVDKIKEANKELFNDEIVVLQNELIHSAESQQNRKVSFATNLEEYEPQYGLSLRELEDNLGRVCLENSEENLQKIEIDKKLEIIREEEAVNEIENNEIYETLRQENFKEGQDQSLTLMTSNEKEENLNEMEQNRVESLKNCASDDVNVILEEICEEILVMDMENDKVEATNITKFDSSVQRKIIKQITFDYTENDDELDKKSLTNLFISDNENDTNDEDENQDYNCNESINNDTDSEDKVFLKNADYYEDDDEDDKLSIIVASYLPEDLVSVSPSAMKSSPRNSKPRKSPTKKRFSFCRKTKSSNAIGSYSNHHASKNNHRFLPPPEVTDLKLHYKSCCELRNAQKKLPNYTGYLSEYGLSREQLIERERKLQRKQQVKVVEILKTSEAENRKMHDNERAFITWLKNKMRFPINKTRNMFDVKRPFGLRKCTSLGGNTLSNDTKQIWNTTKYRSISAKLKKS